MSLTLSGYHGPLYDDLYGDWERIEIATMTGQAAVRSPRTEVLWSNRPRGEHLFSEATPATVGAS